MLDDANQIKRTTLNPSLDPNSDAANYLEETQCLLPTLSQHLLADFEKEKKAISSVPFKTKANHCCANSDRLSCKFDPIAAKAADLNLLTAVLCMQPTVMCEVQVRDS